jgi:phosphoserine phosphatase RsbU/P
MWSARRTSETEESMLDTTAPPRARHAARLLATLVAFELGEDAVIEVLRLAAAENGLEEAEVWTPGGPDQDAELICSVTERGVPAARPGEPPSLRRVEAPVRFGDTEIGRLVAVGPASLTAAALAPWCDALSLLLADRDPEDRYDTLARRFDSRRHLIETIMEQLPVGVAVTNTVGVFQMVNQEMTDIFGTHLTGMSPERWAAGASRLTRLDGSPVAEEDLPLLRTLRGGVQAGPVDFVFRAPGSADLIVATSAAPVLDADGELLACVVTCSDVTAAHRTTRELAATRRELDIEIRDLTRVQALVERLAGDAGSAESLAEVLSAVGDLHDSHAGVVVTERSPGDGLKVVAHRGLTETQVAAIAALDQTELTTSRRAIDGHQVTVTDVATDPRLSRRYRAVMGLLGAVSVHTIPLRTSDGKVIGALASFFDHCHRSSPRETAMVETCARIGAQLVANARARVAEQLIARELQLGMLQGELPGLPGTRLAARYRPATEGMLAGGDWYDVTAVPGAGIGLTIGDVVGHGVEAAAVMGQLRSAVRAYALSGGHNPAGLIGDVDRFVDVTGTGLMTTLAFLFVDSTARTARLASAGHYPPLVLTPGTAEFAHCESLSTPLGVPDPHENRSIDLPLEPGMTIVLYTDGLVERRGEGIEAGMTRLAAAAAAHRGDVEELCDHLLAVCAPADTCHDDIALLALHVVV